MFGIGLPEMIVILAVALIVVGPDKLPELARSLAKGVNELKNTMNQVKENLSEETKVISSVQQDLRKTAIQMKDQLLEEEAKIWRPEDALPDTGVNVKPEEQEKSDAIIEMESLAERPWEKDAAAEPVTVSDTKNEEPESAALQPKAEIEPDPEPEKTDSATADEPAQDKTPPASTA
jgi:sec-independent protein translocase protein TatB